MANINFTSKPMEGSTRFSNDSFCYFNVSGNCSNVTEQYDLIHPVPQIVVPILFAILMLTGVVGNGTLIYTVLRNKSMRNVPNILIVNLSAGDLLLLLMSAPFSATVFILESYPFGELICKMNEYLQTLSAGVSILTLTALSGDRYVAIMYPMSKHKGKPTLKTSIAVAFIWIISAIFAIPDAISFNIQYMGVYYCQAYPYVWREWYGKTHCLFRFFTLFLIPLIIIGTFYCLMARILVKSSRQMPCEATKGPGQSQQQQRQIEARMKVARVVLSFVLLFVVCWLPRHIYLLWFHWGTSDFSDFWVWFKLFGFCLTYVYSCVNPYALYFLSSQFRKYYNRYLFRCCPKSYRLRDSNGSGLQSYSTVRRGSTSLTMVKSNSEM
ncbi:neuropeptide CCHamide-1 receptor-like [Mizuhopecten yessoensis]|uniref:Neuromedin-B receptor n=1 Tax=Mizuhopecten yessoensis TaxID=6573 RepID=A0A210Q6L8_MIZYE|nr:neuropeptide CCHamide-1 receptor-like [Mizuhopecten yessoensis]OWF44383.1 Neuromedin-B receptor [Mizuhopecten yessoensis]